MDLKIILSRLQRPSKAVVTAGMPYANGPLHIGHLAGAQLPADIHARWMGLLIGRENVLYVCGTDDHGSTSELIAMKAGIDVSDAINTIHSGQSAVMERYEIGLDIYSGTSRPETFPRHSARSQTMMRKLYENGLLKKRVSKHWYDPGVDRFLPDRMVTGRCPNPKCNALNAYSDECDACGMQYDAVDLLEPKSAVSNSTPELRDSAHLWLDMWSVSQLMKDWVETKKKAWRPIVLQQVLDDLRPSLKFSQTQEPDYKNLAGDLPKHKRKYARNKEMMLQFESKAHLSEARQTLSDAGIDADLVDGWAYRSISRDIPWGIPMPEVDPDIVNKTLYVWPDSLIAPIAFTEAALEKRGLPTEQYAHYWRDPNAAIYQFLGQDNVFFYVLMQAAMWLGSQDDTTRLPAEGDLQLNDVFGCFHLMVGGHKMSKSRGNFLTAEQLLDERGYSVDQVRYYLALLGLGDKPADFDFEKFDARNAFLAGRMNAAFEKPISAANSKFGGCVPDGVLIDKVEADTFRMAQRYIKSMKHANYPNLLYELENYARKINSLFTKYKPHDDRHPEEQRKNALFSAFYLLKNLMIMLYPFVPGAMTRLRESLQLPETVLSIDELGTGLPAGHQVGQKQVYFPAVVTSEDRS